MVHALSHPCRACSESSPRQLRHLPTMHIDWWWFILPCIFVPVDPLDAFTMKFGVIILALAGKNMPRVGAKTRGNPPRARVDHCPKRPRVMCLQSDDSDPGPNPAIQEIWICSSLTIGLTISFTPRGSSRLNPPAKGLCIGWSDDWVSKWIRWTSRAEPRPAHMGQLMTWIITICNWFSHQQIPPQYFFFIVL